MSVARLEAVEGQDPLAEEFAVLVVDRETEDGQVRQYHLPRGTRQDSIGHTVTRVLLFFSALKLSFIPHLPFETRTGPRCKPG